MSVKKIFEISIATLVLQMLKEKKNCIATLDSIMITSTMPMQIIENPTEPKSLQTDEKLD